VTDISRLLPAMRIHPQGPLVVTGWLLERCRVLALGFRTCARPGRRAWHQL